MNDKSTGGRWLPLFFWKTVKIMIDNTSAVAQINNMGTCHTWSWLTAAHIPGSSNLIADGESRHFHSQETEWLLNPELLTGTLKTINFQRERSIKVITASWREGTTVQYQPCLMKWIEFCKKKKKKKRIMLSLQIYQ